MKRALMADSKDQNTEEENEMDEGLNGEYENDNNAYEEEAYVHEAFLADSEQRNDTNSSIPQQGTGPSISNPNNPSQTLAPLNSRLSKYNSPTVRSFLPLPNRRKKGYRLVKLAPELPPGQATTLSGPTVPGQLFGFTAQQIGQLYVMLHEHVQLLVQVFSVSVLDPAHQQYTTENEAVRASEKEKIKRLEDNSQGGGRDLSLKEDFVVVNSNLEIRNKEISEYRNRKYIFWLSGN